MQSMRSFDLIKFAAAGALACALSLVAGPAAAQLRAPSLNLTPFRLVAPNGKCADIWPEYVNPGWEVSMQPCNPSNNRQLFYLLRSDDTDFIVKQPLENAPVRIAMADSFDKPLLPEYNLLTILSGSPTSALVYEANTPLPIPLQEFVISAVPQTPTITLVANQNQPVGIAGLRTINYNGPAVPPFIYKNVRGTDPGINGQVICQGSFFGVPSGAANYCTMSGVAERYTPVQVQIRNPQTNTCLSRLPPVMVLVGMDSCAASADNVWTLMPANYPGLI